MRTIFFWLLFPCILHNWFAAPFDIYMSVRNNGSGVHEIMQRNEYELSVEVIVLVLHTVKFSSFLAWPLDSLPSQQANIQKKCATFLKFSIHTINFKLYYFSIFTARNMFKLVKNCCYNQTSSEIFLHYFFNFKPTMRTFTARRVPTSPITSLRGLGGF